MAARLGAVRTGHTLAIRATRAYAEPTGAPALAAALQARIREAAAAGLARELADAN